MFWVRVWAMGLLGVSLGEAIPREWVVERTADFATAVVEGIKVYPDSLVVLAPLEAEVNLALGQKAVDEFGREVPLTDGGIAVGESEWLSGTPNVFGRYFVVDLGRDRAIIQVRLLAGGSALLQPEYFVRGYRLEAATQRDPGIWQLLAEERNNYRLNVDTRADSTWAVWDREGQPQPRLGRWVRLTLIRQDRSNWVSLGEIEVFGAGHVAEGRLEAVFAESEAVNVGRVWWQAEIPPQTQVQVWSRGEGEEWQIQESGALFGGAEPLAQFHYRVVLKTEAPFSTPSLRRVAVEWDPVLVARQVLARVLPDTVRKGTMAEVTCAAEVEVGAEDYGVDLVRLQGVALEIDQVRANGATLSPSEYTWQRLLAEDATLIELAPSARLGTSATLEIAGRGLFLQDRTPVILAVGSRRQEAEAGYVNWQNAREAFAGACVVRGLGPPPALLGRVEVAPRPFSPFAAGEVEFRFVVGNLQEEAEVVLEVYTLAGERVRRLAQVGQARAYRFAWDGRDQDGRIVEPGLYLYEIRVEAGDHAAGRCGVLAVAY